MSAGAADEARELAARGQGGGEEKAVLVDAPSHGRGRPATWTTSACSGAPSSPASTTTPRRRASTFQVSERAAPCGSRGASAAASSTSARATSSIPSKSAKLTRSSG